MKNQKKRQQTRQTKTHRLRFIYENKKETENKVERMGERINLLIGYFPRLPFDILISSRKHKNWINLVGAACGTVKKRSDELNFSKNQTYSRLIRKWVKRGWKKRERPHKRIRQSSPQQTLSICSRKAKKNNNKINVSCELLSYLQSLSKRHSRTTVY